MKPSLRALPKIGSRTAALMACAGAVAMVACTSDSGGIWAGASISAGSSGSSGSLGDGGTTTREASAPFDSGPPGPAPCSELPSVAKTGTWSKVAVPAAFSSYLGLGMVAGPGDLYFLNWRPPGSSTASTLVHFSALDGSFTSVPIAGANMPDQSVAPLIGIVNGKLYLYGGSAALGSTEFLTGGSVFDLQTRLWSTLPATNAPTLKSAGVLGDPTVRVVAFGSQVAFLGADIDAQHPALALYDPQLQTWTSVNGPAAYACEQVSFGAGAAFCSARASGPSFLVTNGSAVSFGQVPSPASTATSAAKLLSTFVGNDLVAWDDDATSSLAFRITTTPTVGAWRQVGASFLPRHGPRVVTVNGRAVVWGGTFDVAGYHSRSDGLAYDPVADSWATVSCTDGPTSGSSMLSDGTHGYILGSSLYTLTL